METVPIRHTVLRYYEDRLKNDPRLVLRYFTPEARYVMAGDRDASPVVSTDLGPLKFPDIAPAIVNAWRWRKADVTTLIAEGDRAAARLSLEVEFAPTGGIITTELANFWEFRNGLCVELIEYVDTALVRQIASPPDKSS